MEKHEIYPPDELEIETELADIVGRGNSNSIATWSGIKYWRIRAMLRDDDPSRNIIYEAAAFIYGCVKTDREMAKQVFGVLYRLALRWGLVDEAPVDVLKLAIDRLRSIEKSDIEGMSRENRTLMLADVAELEDVVGRVKTEVILVRKSDANGRAHELGGMGRGDIVNR
jgi:hypothetical protein